jgi:SAM-dependent methyltransferase
VHKAILHLLPEAASDVLDIGAGTGRDAAALAERGHRVVAVEPTEAMRERAKATHPDDRITWLDDSLPDLAVVTGRGERFDVVMMTAVWMHLDEAERRRAMLAVAALMRPGGVLSMTVRHGPVPAGRRMFEISAEETKALAAAEGLEAVVELRGASSEQAGVEWTRLAFKKL